LSLKLDSPEGKEIEEEVISLFQNIFIILFYNIFMISKINNEVLKIEFKNFGSICYLIKDILIDTGSLETRKELIEDFNKNKLNLNDIKIILLTHLHWDHMANISLFPHAKVYCSKQEIESFQEDRTNFIRMQDLSLLPELAQIKFKDIKQFKNKDFQIIEVPGHTLGSLAFLYKDILFSGDTLFDEQGYSIGRTDLPASIPEKMGESVKKLMKIKFKILCPGH
jgi:hydroxyacylglutathione hydrolase